MCAPPCIVIVEVVAIGARPGSGAYERPWDVLIPLKRNTLHPKPAESETPPSSGPGGAYSACDEWGRDECRASRHARRNTARVAKSWPLPGLAPIANWSWLEHRDQGSRKDAKERKGNAVKPESS